MMTFTIVKRPVGSNGTDGFFRDVTVTSLREAELIAEELFEVWKPTDRRVYSLRIYGPQRYAGAISSFCHFFGEWSHSPDFDE